MSLEIHCGVLLDSAVINAIGSLAPRRWERERRFRRTTLTPRR